MQFFLEHQGKAKAYAVLRTEASVVIIHTAHILHLEETEDATDA